MGKDGEKGGGEVRFARRYQEGCERSDKDVGGERRGESS